MEFKAFGAPSLQNIVTQQRAARGLPEKTAIVIPARPEWTQAVIEEQNLQLYDDLFEDLPPGGKPPSSTTPPEDK